MAELDCRGLACPAPVLRTKDFLETHNPKNVNILVDNVAAAENVSRFLGYKGYEVEVKETDDNFVLSASRKNVQTGKEKIASPSTKSKTEPGGEARKILVIAATDQFGSGDEELGKALMMNFLATLKEMGDELWRLVFVNSGVKLTIEGAKTVNIIKELESQGVGVLVCGTCLTHFELMDKKKVGETTNMLDIVTSMQLADKVINIS